MSTIQKNQKIFDDATDVLKSYSLCDSCLGRLFAKKIDSKSNTLLGKKIRKSIKKNKATKCYICKNILNDLSFSLKKIVETITDYQFSSFIVGVILKPSVLDRDDLIRSNFKIQGSDSIKNGIAKEISKKLRRQTKKEKDFLSPDLTITFNFKDNSCEVKSKPIFLFGKYVKETRGLSQKQKSCQDCKGKGCGQCDFHGISNFESVEGEIAKFLYDKFDTKKVTISWIGGEDQNSLVLGTGRPFFVKITNPRKRYIKFSKKIKTKNISINKIRIIPQIPRGPLKFKSRIELSVVSKDEIDPKNLKKLKKIIGSPILVKDNFYKTNKKTIYSLTYRKTSSKSFKLKITAEGGLPVKRLVNGDNVSPNITQILDSDCICQSFDFQEIILDNNK